MAEQACTVNKKEYASSNGVLVIENIFNPNKPKTDIIKEITEDMSCSCDKSLEQSACANTAGPQAKEAIN